MIVFKCLKEFIFQLELTSSQVEIEITEVLLYTVKQISESYNFGLEESSAGILGIDQLLIYCTCTIIRSWKIKKWAQNSNSVYIYNPWFITEQARYSHL